MPLFGHPPTWALSGDCRTEVPEIVETFLDRGVTLCLPTLAVSVCCYLGRTLDVITAESSTPRDTFCPLNDS